MSFLKRASIEILQCNQSRRVKLSRKCHLIGRLTPQVYSTNLCKIDCRIKSALKLCNCIPFFYTVPKVKVCDVDGMLCLAGPSNNNTWYDTRDCECMNLCETTIMTKVSSKEVRSWLQRGMKCVTHLDLYFTYSKTSNLIACWLLIWCFQRLELNALFCSTLKT